MPEDKPVRITMENLKIGVELTPKKNGSQLEPLRVINTRKPDRSALVIGLEEDADEKPRLVRARDLAKNYWVCPASLARVDVIRKNALKMSRKD